MSKKSWFGRKKTSTTATAEVPVPRSKADIDTAYTQACSVAGQIQYRIESAKNQLNQINNEIHNLNNEADARAKIDAEEKSKAAPAVEAVANV